MLGGSLVNLRASQHFKRVCTRSMKCSESAALTQLNVLQRNGALFSWLQITRVRAKVNKLLPPLQRVDHMHDIFLHEFNGGCQRIIVNTRVEIKSATQKMLR
jgi:hypothetical protein